MGRKNGDKISGNELRIHKAKFVQKRSNPRLAKDACRKSEK